MTEPGRVVVLNGVPRSGKTSIARALQALADEPWLNLGVDTVMRATPARFHPGIGLRPGGERPDLEPLVESLYLGLYDAMAAQARWGVNVVADVGHHDRYSTPRHILPKAARRMTGLPVLFVGVRCTLEEIMRRRAAGDRDRYLAGEPGGAVPEPVRRWQDAVHDPGIYDVEVDTTATSAHECAAAILDHLHGGAPPIAFRQLAR